MRRHRHAAITTDVMRPTGRHRYLDPAALARFGITPLLARRIVEGFINGLHKSPFHGFSVEFADHREYAPGDDLRFLDWTLLARTDHYYIKRYEQETNLRCHILLDQSASMAFGTVGITKWDYGCLLASCLTYLMLKHQDAVGLALLGIRPGLLVPPRCRGSHLNQIMRTMIQNPPTGTTDLAASLRSTLGVLKRRSLVVLISDLIDDPEATLKAIRLVRSHRHDVIVFHVQDPAEVNFTFQTATLFRDLETGEQIEVDPATVRTEYLARFKEVQDLYRRKLQDSGIEYAVLDLHQPYENALRTYLQKRASMRI